MISYVQLCFVSRPHVPCHICSVLLGTCSLLQSNTLLWMQLQALTPGTRRHLAPVHRSKYSQQVHMPLYSCQCSLASLEYGIRHAGLGLDCNKQTKHVVAMHATSSPTLILDVIRLPASDHKDYQVQLQKVSCGSSAQPACTQTPVLQNHCMWTPCKCISSASMVH